MPPLLLNETYILSLIGYFLLAVAGVALVVMFLIGRLVFSMDKKTALGKIGRVVYLVVGGGVVLMLAAMLYS